MEFLTLNKLRQVLKEEKIDIKKHLGQNFLIDRNARDKILSFAGLKKEDVVVEIGPGLGSLTEFLLENVKEVYAFEIDPHFCSILSKRFSKFKNFHLIEKDFLESKKKWWDSLPKVYPVRKCGPAPLENFSNGAKVIGNTPYYISSPIVFHILKFLPRIDLALLTVQKEVGERFAAECGNKNYGIISVLLSLYTDTQICYCLKKQVFYPMPEVDSVVVKIAPLSKPRIEIKSEKKFWDFLPLIFSYRRKKISNVVERVFHINKKEFEKNLREKEISENIRVEQLPPEKIYQIFEIVQSFKKVS